MQQNQSQQQMSQQQAWQAQQQAAQQAQSQQMDQRAWKPREYFTRAESVALLASQTPEETLNKVFNQTAQSVYEPLRQELEQTRAYNDQLRQVYLQDRAADDAARRAQANEAKFYSTHEDIKPYSYLVPVEAQAMAQESVSNPAAYAGRSESEIHGMLASRVLAKVKAIRGEGTAEVSVATPAAASRTYMERGSGIRASAPAPSKDANKAALGQMHQFMRGAQSRPKS